MLLVMLLILIIFILLKKMNVYDNFGIRNKFCVIVTTYNPGADFLDRCLETIERQNYKNYDVCILDDASNKDTEKMNLVIADYCSRNGWKSVRLEQNGGPLLGRIRAIEELKPNDEDIIVSVDGDDELANSKVLSLLNSKYQDNTLVTFGNFKRKNIHTGELGKPFINCRRYDFNKMAKENSFRDKKWMFSHLKTFKYKVYKEIDHNDLKKNGEYLRSATDLALMYPMLEMCGNKIKCVPDILYHYNHDHPESHNDKSSTKHKKQTANAKFVKNLPKYTCIF